MSYLSDRRKRLGPWLLAMALSGGAGVGFAELSPELLGRLDGLDEAQQAFVTSGAIFDYLPERQLEHEVMTRDPAALATMLSDLLEVATAMGYNP